MNYILHDDLYGDDNILDSITFNEVILAAQNDSRVWVGGKDETAQKDTITKICHELIQSQVEEAWDMFYRNLDEIYKDVFDIEDEPEEDIPLTERQRENLAKEIYEFLKEYGIWIDVNIYYNGKVMTPYCREEEKYYYNEKAFEYEDEPTKYFEYVRKPNILSMSFEGELYSALNWYGNYDWCVAIEAKLTNIFKKYGLYFELGNAWNLSAYEL